MPKEPDRTIADEVVDSVKIAHVKTGTAAQTKVSPSWDAALVKSWARANRGLRGLIKNRKLMSVRD